MAKEIQDYINENREIKKYNLQLTMEIDRMQREIDNLRKKVAQSDETIRVLKDELFNILSISYLTNIILSVSLFFRYYFHRCSRFCQCLLYFL